MIAILGAGNGGLALAAHLTRAGKKVALWNRSSARLEQGLLKEGEIFVRDLWRATEWKVRIPMVSLNLKEVVENASTIFVVTPGTAHLEIARELVPLLKEGQKIFLMPGRTFGSFLFYNEFERYGLKDISCFESQSILFTCRGIEGGVDLFAIKKRILFSCPVKANEQHIHEVLELLPNMVWEKNYYSVTLNNIGAMLHPLPTLLNAARIESGEKFYFYSQGITPAISNVIESLDEERALVCRARNAEFLSVANWLKEEYGSSGTQLYEVLSNTAAYKAIPAPTTLQHRYLIDDTITGLVPLYYAGLGFGIEMPLTKNIIDLSSKILNRNLLEEGRKNLPNEKAKH